jgi:hypothetical protein
MQTNRSRTSTNRTQGLGTPQKKCGPARFGVAMEQKKIISLQSELAEIEKAEGLDTKWKRELQEQMERCKNATDDEPSRLAASWKKDSKGTRFDRNRVVELAFLAEARARKINALPVGHPRESIFL